MGPGKLRPPSPRNLGDKIPKVLSAKQTEPACGFHTSLPFSSEPFHVLFPLPGGLYSPVGLGIVGISPGEFLGASLPGISAPPK